MSDTALQGAVYRGYVHVSEAKPRPMVSLKGDLSDESLRDAVRLTMNSDFPEALSVIGGDKGQVAWMAPDELLLFPESAAEALSSIQHKLGDAHVLALDVSDMRTEIVLKGAGAREVLAKASPVDFGALPPGTIRRTRIAQVPAAIWLADAETAHVICFRSVARYVFDVMAMGARKGGEIGVF
ncbi:Sarcosine oxidase, gamma subunit family [Rhodobacteraceae bacterium THAF1]|uniref:sarcosine oxidase subunit gamma n=1 Tax=Palleronia sp. THAF1 TaxID=2587842 RepID=UPI000F3AD672|nr:sarcosine oxidase subunit gamma family protein [Palleronia sp. THAF1]QFU08463.1 Sarcosine oxidase, gamma subunit family [Palleronia sp. THAF1]VDC29368.1 Sarcosine oxidase, gamma subunit family [Rhodobacteraceae bacterium THAF1]